MLATLAITAPIFIVIALGFATVRIGLVPSDWLPALGGFVVRIALPALIFKSLSQRSFDEVLNLRYLGAYAAASLLLLGFGIMWAKWARRLGLEGGAMMGMGMACANSGYVGYPIALQVVGPAATVALALSMMVENMLMIPLCLALADTGSASHEPFYRAMGGALARLRGNPIVLAIVAGIAFAVLQINIPAPITHAVEMCAGASAPVALFFIGGSLVGLPLRGMFLDMSVVSFGKLVLHPMAICAGLFLIGPVDSQLGLSAILLGSSPMLSIYPIFGQKHGMQGFCAATLLMATVASFVTIGATIWILHVSRYFVVN